MQFSLTCLISDILLMKSIESFIYDGNAHMIKQNGLQNLKVVLKVNQFQQPLVYLDSPGGFWAHVAWAECIVPGV